MPPLATWGTPGYFEKKKNQKILFNVVFKIYASALRARPGRPGGVVPVPIVALHLDPV